MGTNHPEEKFWERFCDITDQQHLKHDPRYADTESRSENAAELMEIYDEVFKVKTRDEWMHIFRNNGFMYAPVQQLEEVLNDKQALVNDYVVDFDHPFLGQMKLPGFPVTFSANRAGTRGASPGLGEHTDSVMKDIGYSDDDVRVLRREGVIK
jgi:crotonobetainyl-CoA:carnitine CoA-transferase CaiB-like acyl-CoA transferase